MPSLKEGFIGRFHQGTYENIQILFDIPPLTSVTVSYSPPPNRVYVPVYHFLAPGPSGVGRFISFDDGDVEFTNFITTRSAEGLFEKQIIHIDRIISTFVITNLDVYTHTVDFSMYGYLIPEHEINDLRNELTGRKDRKELEEIKEEIKKIQELISELLEKKEEES